MRRKLCRRPTGGFTLVELLVVIVIIAILVAVVMPAFQKAKERGRQIRCIANVKAVMSGIFLYAFEHDKFLAPETGYEGRYMEIGGAKPGARDADGRPVLDETRLLYKHIRDAGVFECPADRGSTWGKASSDNCFEKYGTSYAFAADPVDKDMGGIGGVLGKKMTAIPIRIKYGKTEHRTMVDSSKKVVVFEPGLATDQKNPKDRWHLERVGAVVGFLDGHSVLVPTNYPTRPQPLTEERLYY